MKCLWGVIVSLCALWDLSLRLNMYKERNLWWRYSFKKSSISSVWDILDRRRSQSLYGYSWNGATSISWEDGERQVGHFFWSSAESLAWLYRQWLAKVWLAKVVPDQLRPYHAAPGDLSIAHCKVIYRNRLVISSALQSEVLERIHDDPQGITKFRERANMSVWWPGISCDMKTKV